MSTGVSNDYSPLYIVRQSHNILHLDSSLGEVSNDFSITYDSQWNDYSRSLLPIPILCGAMGVLAIVILQLAICFRMCCKSCRCLPRIRTSRGGNSEIFDRDTLPRYRVLCYVFLAFAVIIILTNQMLLFGNRYLTEGVDTSRDGIDFLHDLTTTLTNEGNDLLTYGDVLQSELESASSTCAPANGLANGVSTQYDSYVNDYLSYVNPIPGRCDDANNGLDTWEYYKNTSLWVIYAVVWMITVAYSVGTFFKQRFLLQIGLGFTQFVMLVIFFIIGTLMVILIGFGDFCMDPITYTGGLLPRDIYNVTYYYLDCQGVNPISGDLDDAYQFVDGYYTYINSLYSGAIPVAGCTGNTYLQQSLTELTTINSTLNEISANIVCPPIQSQLSDVLQTGLCTEGFKGIYTIWLGNYITVSCLLVATILISLIYQYFGQYWGGDVEQQNDDVIIVNENPALFADVQLTHQTNGNDSPNEFYYNTSTLHKEPPLSA